jgi:quinol monooxygenase YgiN
VRALYAEFTVRPGCESRVTEFVHALTAEVRREPGSLAFDPCTRVEQPRSWVVFERYRDEPAFQAHLTSEHCRAFNAALADLIEGDGSVLTWLTPLP